MNTSSLTALRLAALRLLTRRDYTAQELKQKLAAKCCTHEDIDAVLGELIENKWLDEKRTATHYIDAKRAQGYGPVRISIKLAARGISSALIAELLETPDPVWQEAAHHVWQKRFKGARPCNAKEAAKQLRFLLYRGFTRQQIEKVLSKPGIEIFY